MLCMHDRFATTATFQPLYDVHNFEPRYLRNTIWNLGLKASKERAFQACSDLFLRCAQLWNVEQPEGLERTKLLLMLGADALVLDSKERWQRSGTEAKQQIVGNIERALICIQRCRSLMMRSAPNQTSSANTEDPGLPHLAVVECRARCLLIDATNADDVDSLTSVLHAAEELQSTPSKCFVQIYDVSLNAGCIIIMPIKLLVCANFWCA